MGDAEGASAGIASRLLDEDDALVAFKLSILERAMPAKDAVVFGDMYRVDGGYTVKCLDMGCERATLIDTLETHRWVEARQARPELDFMKGDFSNPLFMSSFDGSAEVGVAYDVLLHQPSLLGAINLMLAKVTGRFCVVQPVLRERELPNSLVYLPGNTAAEELYPLKAAHDEYLVFEPEQVNHSNWIWGLTPSFLTSALLGEGFERVVEDELGPLPNPNWFWWGAIFERRKPTPSQHWSAHGMTPGIYTGDW